jgi:hypothetical protein
LRRVARRGQDAAVRAVFVLSAAIILTGCDPAPPIAPDGGAHRFGEAFVTRARAPQKVGREMLVSFEGVSADSRCPRTVTCVWQGAAEVKLKALTLGESRVPHSIALATAPESEQSAEYHGYRIELLDVAPYPTGTTPPAPGEYTVTLRVTRAQ